MNLVALPAFTDNYVWMLHDGHRAVVVDPGEASPVEAALDSLGLERQAILVTGHIAYFSRDAGPDPLLFCGDTLFSAGCGRLFEGTAAQLHASLERLAALPGRTRVCCTHEYTLSNLRFACAVEPANADAADHLRHCQRLREQGAITLPSSIERERLINPFLRCAEPAVVTAARREGAADDSPVAVFAALREWKNRFR